METRTIQKELNTPSTVSVSQYLDGLNITLRRERAKIVGEVSGLQMYEGRTYLYFSIKDSKDQSTIKCFMWKNDYRISGVNVTEGMEVIVTAYPSVYKPNGGLTLQVELVEAVGEGALKLAYDELKKKLTAEGLFDVGRKRQLPLYPHKIGVITSKSGAVIHDFLTNIGKFGFDISFVDSKVEGQDAIKDLLASIATLKRADIDVLVIMRGGGSLESFLAFNNEALVRAVADFPVPVVTGIGHDKDAPLISLVSDINVSTPTAVTHLLNESWDEALSQVRLSEERIYSQFGSMLQSTQFLLENAQMTIEHKFTKLFETFKTAERALFSAFSGIGARISHIGYVIDESTKNITRGFEAMIQREQDILVQSKKTLDAGNPERQLAFGYSIVKKDGKVVKKVADVPKGSTLDIALSDGIIQTHT